MQNDIQFEFGIHGGDIRRDGAGSSGTMMNSLQLFAGVTRQSSIRQLTRGLRAHPSL